MKRNILLLVLALLTAGGADARVRKTLYIVVDGIPATDFERLKPPTISEIAAAGGYARAYCGGAVARYSETPTISAIGYANIITGTWMNKHNVKGNENIQANYNYPTIFRMAKDQPGRDVKTAIYSSWTDNRLVLLGEGKPETRNLKVDYTFDGYDIDPARFPKKPDDLQILDYDAEACRNAAKCIRENAPDLNWVYMWYTDAAYHMYGKGKKADWSVMATDSLIKPVWEAVKEREKNHKEDWLVIVLTDHGRQYNGRHHGGQSDPERTVWMATNLKKRNKQFGRATLSHADVVPTICKWMGFSLPQATRFELDGTSFYGKEDIHGLRLDPWDKFATLHWTNNGKDVPVEIWCSTTNNIATGGTDNWVKLATVSSRKGKYTTTDPTIHDSPLAKFALVTPNTTLTTWWKL